MLFPRLNGCRAPTRNSIHRLVTGVPEAIVVFRSQSFADLRYDQLVRHPHDLLVTCRIHDGLICDGVRCGPTVVGVDLDVRLPLMDHLGQQSLDLLRLQLQVIPVHVEVLLVCPAHLLCAIRIDRRNV